MISSIHSPNKTSDLASDFDDLSRKQIGERLRCVWLDSGLTQGDFSDLLNISSVTLSNYMKGARVPDALFINKLGTRLNICLEWLLVGTGPMRRDEALGTHTQPLQGPQAAQVEHVEQGPVCPRCAKLEQKLELVEQERREIAQENRQLWKENKDLSVENAVLKAGSKKQADNSDYQPSDRVA